MRSHCPTYMKMPYGSRTWISTFEILNNRLIGEIRRKKIGFGREQVFAEYCGIVVLGVLRTYKPTSPGKRSMKYRLELVSPEKDVGIDLDRNAERARERYRINLV